MKIQKIIIVVGLLAVFIAGIKIFKQLKNTDSAATETIFHQQSASLEQLDAVNGLLVQTETAKLRPLAVMVENHPDSRPQSGLDQADIVYETLAEGGITRFEAIYQTKQASVIGPVRSARDYFAQIADEWAALYAHVGGSNEVIDQLKRGVYKNLDDANEYYNEFGFIRRAGKYAPHNVYTSVEKLRDLILVQEFKTSAQYAAWKFKDGQPAGTSTAPVINIDFSRPGYEVRWEYQKDTNDYLRFLSGNPHKDGESKAQLTAKTIIVQYVKVEEVPKDPLLRVDIDLASGGQAIVFQDGVFMEGVWKKEDKTRFYDKENQEIQFNRGQIWVELVPKEKTVKWQ